MIYKTTVKQLVSWLAPWLAPRLAIISLSLVMTGCGFHLQGQNQAAYPTVLSLYTDDSQLESELHKQLLLQQVDVKLLDRVNNKDITQPLLTLTKSLKQRAELILDANGEVTIWRYSLTTHYNYQALQASVSEQTFAASIPLSVSTDVDLSGAQATVNERLEADSWALLYRQLGSRVMRQLSRQQ
jgi:outer membrane lipopolysaccharide assembly protein LptE/RlpB